jgi:hypothetical protein
MTNFNNLHNNARAEITQMIIDYLENYESSEVLSEIDNFEELHNEIFNTDYFIIGYYQAEEWLKNNIGVFNAIGIIKDYEMDQFGELYTDISSSEKVVNMFVYIIGEEIICNLDENLTIKEIISYLNNL